MISPQNALSMLQFALKCEQWRWQNGGFKMLETIIIVICAVICIGAAGFAWWMENGPDKGNDIKDDVKLHTENQNLN